MRPRPTAPTVAVSGVSPSNYNGSYQVLTSSSGQITYSIGTCPGSSPSGGTMMSETVNTYDGDGNVTFTRDEQGDMTGTAYDLDDQSLGVSDPGSSLSVLRQQRSHGRLPEQDLATAAG